MNLFSLGDADLVGCKAKKLQFCYNSAVAGVNQA